MVLHWKFDWSINILHAISLITSTFWFFYADWLFDDTATADGTRSSDIYAESSSTWNYRDEMDEQRIGSSASNYNRLHVDDDDQSKWI